MTFRLLTCADSPEQAKRMLEEMATYCRAHGYELELEDSTESPKARILPAAEEWNADLIVLSISGQKLWLLKILGDTTLHTIRNAERPLYLSH